MRTWVKVLLWALAFAAAAGAGAYVAANTDPFPPGVTDPGERPQVTSATPTLAPEPDPRRWQLRATVRSEHRLHVGGTCTSDWVVQGVFGEASDGGRITGEGVATLREGGCPFPTADVQAETVILRITASRPPQAGARAPVRVTAAGRPQPTGSRDLGGFLELLDPARVTVRTRGSVGVVLQRPDGNDGTFRAVWNTRIRCIEGC